MRFEEMEGTYINKFVAKYGQILLPLITPYDANEDVDYGKYAELIEYLIEKTCAIP